MRDDETLYYLIRKGNEPAFDELYKKYNKRLFAFIYRYLKNREDANEVFHEAFIKVLNSPEVDFKKGNFRGWIYLISRNISLNRLRSLKRGNQAILSLNFSGSPTNSEDFVIEKDLGNKLKEAASKLPSKMLDLFNMRISGLANKEISEALQIPIGTVKSRLHAMVECLKKEIST